MKEFNKMIDSFDSIQTTQFPQTVAGIGKFHIPAHKPDCRFKFSLGYLPVGETDGESPERLWSVLNGLALRTREMTAGHRHDVMNDYMNDMNVRRTHGLRSYQFLRRPCHD